MIMIYFLIKYNNEFNILGIGDKINNFDNHTFFNNKHTLN